MNITVDGLAWLPFSEMGGGQASWLRRKLTIADAPGRRAVLTKCYVENLERGLLGIPRGFFYDGVTKEHLVTAEVSFGGTWPDRRDESDVEQSDDEKELTLIGSFGEEARRGYQAALSHFGSQDVAGGILCFPAISPAIIDAYIVCCALVRALRLRTLILVQDELSVKSWTEVVEQVLPDVCVGYSPSNHLVVATIDEALSYQEAADHVCSFGMVVAADLDIVELVKWARFMSLVPAAKRVGIASDKLDLSGPRKLISYHLGQRVFTGRRERLDPKIRRVWSQWRLGGSSRVNPLFISKDIVVDSMTMSPVYNQHVVEQVVLALKADRKVVVFSEHLKHLKILRKEIESAWVGEISVDYLIDGMGRLDMADAIASRVILTLYSMVKSLPEVVDVDTVVLATPVKNPLGAVSCSLIPGSGKKDPVVVDMRCDGIPVCKEYGVARDGVYQRVYGEERT